MLCLSRKKDERIYIGHDQEIEIMVIEIRKDKVRLGITAPKDIPIVRDDCVDLGRNPGNRSGVRVHPTPFNTKPNPPHTPASGGSGHGKEEKEES